MQARLIDLARLVLGGNSNWNLKSSRAHARILAVIMDLVNLLQYSRIKLNIEGINLCIAKTRTRTIEEQLSDFCPIPER